MVEPAFVCRPPFKDTLGPEVADVCRLAGFEPDPEQQLALDILFAFGPTGKAAAFEFALICSRQNMKTGLFKMAALGWLFVTEQRLIVWSAHEMKTTKEAFLDLENLITGSPVLKARLAGGPSEGIFHAGGQESIELATGQRIMFKARTSGGGRGLSGDKVILDEALWLKPSHMGSLLPTLSARPDPQVVYGSSAGLAESEVLRSIRDRGRTGDDPSLAYLEWCDDLPGDCGTPLCGHELAAADCRLDDRGRWQRANPAMGRRITVDYIAAERRALPPEEFARERLGWWDEDTGLRVISEQTWRLCFDPGSHTDAPYFAVDISPDRGFASITAAGVNGDRMHVEVTSRDGVFDHRPGTDWLMPRFEALKTSFPSMRVTIASGSGAESLRMDLETAGIPVDLISAHELSAACGLFFDHVHTRRLAHLAQSPLDDAVAAAKRRVEDGETAWVWGRKRSAGDITPLYAATLALYSAVEALNMSRHPVMNVW